MRERIAAPGAPAGAVAGPVAVGQPAANLAAPGAPVAANAVAANVAVVQAARPAPPKPAGKGLGHNLKQWGFADVKDGDTWRIAEVIEVKEDNLQFRFLVHPITRLFRPLVAQHHRCSMIHRAGLKRDGTCGCTVTHL